MFVILVGSLPTLVSAQNVIFSENFEGLDLGPNVDEGLNEDDPRDEVWSPDGPEGWTVDRTGVPGFGTPADGVTEFAGWNFVDPIWWAEVAGQQRDFFIDTTESVVAVADGDEWDDAFREPGNMNTFLTTPPIALSANGSNTLGFETSWRPDGTQVATITASYDGGAAEEILRWESDPNSDFFEPDLNPDFIEIDLDAPAGAQEVVLTFGYTEAGNNWWWAIDNLELGGWSEDFEGVELGPNIDEGRAKAVDDVWTKEPPPGWSIEDMVPGQDEENDLNGVTEWIGWSFTDKDWWIGVAGDQRRSEFTNGEGAVAVADPDEWDDADHLDSAAEGWYNTYLETPPISLDGVDANSIKLTFDSSWRDEFDDDYQQTANITVKFDDGPEEEILLWESDPDSDDFKDDAPNETIILDINNPADASSMVLTFGLFDAGNDWWWAIDNIEVTASGGGVLPGDYNMDGQVNVDDIDLQSVEMKNENPDLAKFDENNDGVVNIDDRQIWIKTHRGTWVGDANLDDEFNSGDLVAVFAAGKYETGEMATWAQGDWNGDMAFDSGDLVAAFSDGGYEQGPAVAAVPEPSTLAATLIGLLGLGFRRRMSSR